MLHLHFGAGRLGLGLVVPFFRTASSETIIFNRSVSGAKPTGGTELAPDRRNALLRDNPDHLYLIETPGTENADRQVVLYDAFRQYTDHEIADDIRDIVENSSQSQDGIVVTASLISAGNYPPVMRALETIAAMREADGIGPIFLVACENTLSAPDLFGHADVCDCVTETMQRHVTCVHGLVDRVCVGLAEAAHNGQPTVLVNAEEYGSLKLELNPETEVLVDKLAGSRVEFTRHVAIEKQIKSWLLNGTHWLLALAAFQESEGDQEMRLNAFLKATPERLQFAHAVMDEMREGVAQILKSEPEYAAFARDVDVDDYLDGAAKAILARFLANDDPITRILARFQAPTPDAPATIQAFSKRFADRVDQPISAYAEKTGAPPPAATRSVQSLVRLIASGTYINAA